jgi:two-component system, response regulator PdtaR
MEKRAIVIVEDDSIIQLSLQRMLENNGHAVVGTASEGEEASRVIRQSHPDAIVMDVHLKGRMSGIDVYRNMSREGLRIPVIFLTAYDPDVVTELRDLEECEYVKKPYIDKEILRKLEKVCLRNRKQEHPDEALATHD